VSYLTIFVLLNVQVSKAYYLFAAYPPLFAAGSVAVQRLASVVRKRWIKGIAVGWCVLNLALAVPLGSPLLPPPQFVAFSRALGIEFGAGERWEVGAMPQYFADRIGWRNMVVTIAGVYDQLSEAEQSRIIIFAGDYGEAGAVDYFGDEFNLPRAYSVHNNYWLWGPPKEIPDIFLVIGVGREELESAFETVEARDTVTCNYCNPSENNQPVFICRGYKYNLPEIWPRLRNFI
jgi:hypothetical protein